MFSSYLGSAREQDAPVDKNTIMISFGDPKWLGNDGKEFDKSKTQFHKAQAKLIMVPTENEMLSQMAPVDWRYLS